MGALKEYLKALLQNRIVLHWAWYLNICGSIWLINEEHKVF
jgi:hypothetical protein